MTSSPPIASAPKPRWRRATFKVAQWMFAIAVLVYAFKGIHDQWTDVRGRVAALHFDWSLIILSSLLVLLVYAILIDAWRRVLGAWDRPLDWVSAARIWFASSLGKYIPGYIWSLSAMGALAHRTGRSGIAAAGSAVVVNGLNLGAGIAITLVCAAKMFPNPAIGYAALVLVVACAIGAPSWLPKIAIWLNRVTGKNFPVPRIPAFTIWLVLFIATVAWIGYGIAFQIFSHGILPIGDADVGSVLAFIAAYTGSYIVGLLSGIPSGIGVREGALWQTLPTLTGMSAPDAVVIAVTSRLWLSVLEILPGLIALAFSQRPPSEPSSHTRDA